MRVLNNQARIYLTSLTSEIFRRKYTKLNNHFTVSNFLSFLMICHTHYCYTLLVLLIDQLSVKSFQKRKDETFRNMLVGHRPDRWFETTRVQDKVDFSNHEIVGGKERTLSVNYKTIKEFVAGNIINQLTPLSKQISSINFISNTTLNNH